MNFRKKLNLKKLNLTEKSGLILLVVGIVLGALGLSNLIFGWPPLTLTITEIIKIGEEEYYVDWLYDENEPPIGEPKPFDIRSADHPSWAKLEKVFEDTRAAYNAISKNVSLPHREADFTILAPESDIDPIGVVIHDPKNWQDFIAKRNKSIAFFRKYKVDICNSMIAWIPEDRELFRERVGDATPPAELQFSCETRANP